MQPVLVEIEQHQAARKQQPEDLVPAERRGEHLRLVEQHELVGVGAEQADAGFAEQMGAIDEAVFGETALDMALGVGERVQRLADDRPAFVTRNMGQ